MPTVLILDDQSISRMILEELARSTSDDVRTETFSDPLEALTRAEHFKFDLVVADYKMPGMNGITFTKQLREFPSCSDIPVVMVTAVSDKSVRYEALEAGATDFLSKPIDHHECRARMKNLLQLSRQQTIIKGRARWLELEVNKKTIELQLREKETLLRLAKAGEYRDEETGNHIIRMSEYARLIASGLGLAKEQVETIRLAAPMHDIGKIGIPDHILLKPGKLDPDEWAIMRTHAQIGYEILRDSASHYIRSGAVIALGHHEKFDGTGYPNKLAGDDIPIEARVSTVADVFDALLSKRPYKKPWTLEKALEYMRNERGRHFDPHCVDAFLNQIDQVTAIMERLPDDVD